MRYVGYAFLAVGWSFVLGVGRAIVLHHLNQRHIERAL